MELRQLKYFLAVADARSFVSAAEKQFISRQAISKSVALLEEELNVELFMRDSGGAFLTPAGMMFYERVRTLVAELESVRSQMQSYGNRYQQRIRIGFSVGTVQLFEQRLLEYREESSNTEITYEEQSEEQCRQMLMEHKVDMIITTQQLDDPMFATKQIISSPFGIWIRQQEELQDVHIKDLSWIPLAGGNDSQSAAYCKNNSINLRFSGYDSRRLLELTAAGKCAWIMPKCLAPQWLSGVTWLPVEPAEAWRLYMSYPRNTQKNLMFSDALDTLQRQVFMPLPEKERSL